MRIYGSPHRYYQGAGVFDRLGEIVAPLGTNPLIVIDAFMLETLGARLMASLEAASLNATVRAFSGEISYPAIDELIDTLRGKQPSASIGIGGGKALDAAKAVALKLGLPVVTVPTAASNDSPTSASIAMYDDNHVMIAVDRLSRNPEAVVVDTAIIASAPAKFLRAGIGDAIAKRYEADGCRRGSGRTPYGTRPLITGAAVADICYRTLREHAVEALASAERGEVSDALEAVVEANVLMSGLGFENGGLSLAHSLTRGLVKARGAKDAIHGDQVAYGTLFHVALEGRPDAELRDLVDFLRSVRLPCTLAELGMADVTDEELNEIARWTMTAPHLVNFPKEVTQADIVQALKRVEALAAVPS